MKKMTLWIAGIVTALFAGGCCIPNNCFSSVGPGLLYTQTTHTNYVGEQITDTSKLNVINPVHGSATAVNVLGLISCGDCSVRDARNDAIKGAISADDVLNMQVSTRVLSVLGIFTTVTTQVDGVAVRYHR